jgi:5'(3')-deoxyribonucleotidase
MKTLYLDMDGVLTDFENHWVSLFGRTALQSRDKKEFIGDWDTFIETKQFEQLPWHKTGQELLLFVRSLPNIHIEMLTSSGGKKHHDKVKSQKEVWLKTNGIAYKPNVVAGRRLKAEYATSDTILIDDTPDVIESFNKAGGIGILHYDLEVTKTKLLTALE